MENLFETLGEIFKPEKPAFKTANLQFKDPKHNYSTSVNGNLSDSVIKAYFEGRYFNFGEIKFDFENDCEIETVDMQQCVKCEII